MNSVVMMSSIAVGLVVISITVFIQAVGLLITGLAINGICAKFDLDNRPVGRTLMAVATVLALFVIHTVEVWTWAVAYWYLDLLPSFWDALYFSTVNFTTLGSSDVVLSSNWRLFAALEGIDGLILIGWSIAYLIVDMTRNGLFYSSRHSDAP